ncbi:hypothetical protein JCM9534A_12110 [Catenuloplanes indicus JCM 9534]
MTVRADVKPRDTHNPRRRHRRLGRRPADSHDAKDLPREWPGPDEWSAEGARRIMWFRRKSLYAASKITE